MHCCTARQWDKSVHGVDGRDAAAGQQLHFGSARMF
jgi:hypothetical protein